MRKGIFIVLLAGAAVSWPVKAHTQQNALVIGVMGAGSHSAYSDHLLAFQAALAEMTFVEHRNVAFTYRWADCTAPGSLDTSLI